VGEGDYSATRSLAGLSSEAGGHGEEVGMGGIGDGRIGKRREGNEGIASGKEKSEGKEHCVVLH